MLHIALIVLGNLQDVPDQEEVLKEKNGMLLAEVQEKVVGLKEENRKVLEEVVGLKEENRKVLEEVVGLKDKNRVLMAKVQEENRKLLVGVQEEIVGLKEENRKLLEAVQELTKTNMSQPGGSRGIPEQ